MMNTSRTEQLTELLCILFLFFHTLWHLIFFERSTTLVIVSFGTLVLLLVYSVIRHWRGLKSYGVRFDNLIESLRSALLPIVLVIVGCLLLVVINQKSGRWPQPKEVITFLAWGIAQQTIVQGYFFLQYHELVRRKWAAILLTAITFSCIHIPNRDLMIITFLGCLYISHFYYVHRNLVATGLLHGVISLTIVLTLKEGHVISDNYRVGPDPLGPMRYVIHTALTDDHQVAEYVPSSVPGSFKDHFDRDVLRLETVWELADFMKGGKPVFTVLSEEDLELFVSRNPGVPVYVWKESLMWRRKFHDDRRKTLEAIFSLRLDRLDDLYRERMILISNRPKLR